MKTPDECAYCGERRSVLNAATAGPLVYCQHCYAMGPSRPTRDEAVEAWNRVARAVRALAAAEAAGESTESAALPQ